MISCAKRKAHLAATVNLFRGIAGDVDLQVVIDATACEDRGLVVERPQERQERVSLLAIEQGLSKDSDFILFLEDDLDFNDHLIHNILNWAPLVQQCLDLGSLYNPSVVGPNDACRYFDNTRIADPNKIYGSQAFIISRKLAKYCIEEWWSVEGMQDIKISRLAAAMPDSYLICYHSPSLVQHVGMNSAWTEDSRFHQANDFSKDWKA